jgi:hypothetical protein
MTTDSSPVKSPSPPLNRPHKDTEDRQAAFAAISAKTPVDREFRAAFARSKLHIAYTHPGMDRAARDRAVASLVDRLGQDAAKTITQPSPGGVGEGFFYTPAFNTGWGLGTSFGCDFVCPVPPGGNVNTWLLYLTATNRSGLSVEAFVSYDGQDIPHFRVYDWARTDPWQTDVPFTSLDNYITTMSAHGNSYPVLPVWNGTWAISPGTYRNQALLYNNVRAGWDLVYQYDYAATDSQQKTGWAGSWAPMVETFQSPMPTRTQWGRWARS